MYKNVNEFTGKVIKVTDISGRDTSGRATGWIDPLETKSGEFKLHVECDGKTVSFRDEDIDHIDVLVDYDKEHYCPVYDKVIGGVVCYETVMAF